MTTEGEAALAKLLEEIRRMLFYLVALQAASAAVLGVRLAVP